MTRDGPHSTMEGERAIPPEDGLGDARERRWRPIGGVGGSLVGLGAAAVAVLIDGASIREGGPWPSVFREPRLPAIDVYLLAAVDVGVGFSVSALLSARRGPFPRTDASGAGLMGALLTALAGLIFFCRILALTAGTWSGRSPGVEAPMRIVRGVVSTISGYAGGIVPNPTYEQVSTGGTGHAEVVQIIYDPEKITYEQLLDVFWRNVDPLDKGGQFCDRGLQYRTAIFYEDDDQKQAALASREKLEQSGRLPGPVVTGVLPLDAFYRAEEYHQDFYLRSYQRYWRCRAGCGRNDRLKELWGDSED